MRLSLILSAVLLSTGVGVPGWVVFTSGPPWGFRGRAAVVLESVGSVELSLKAPRAGQERSRRGEPGLGVYTGDEVRVGSLSQVRLRLPFGEVTLGDGAQATLEHGVLTLGRGLLDVFVLEGQQARVRSAPTGVTMLLEPGRYHAAADGRVAFFLRVEQGRAETELAALEPLGAGQMMRSIEGRPAERVPVAEKLKLEARIERAAGARGSTGGVVKGRAEVGTQVYVDGALYYPDPDGSFSVDVPPGDEEVIVFARDPAGNVATKTPRRGG